MKKIALLLFCISLMSSPAQNPEKDPKPFIEVTGTAEMEIIPDELFVTIVLRERGSGKDKVTIESQEEQLKNAVKENGIPLANLSLSDVDANYTKIKILKKDVIASKRYLVKLSDVAMVNKLFTALEKMDVHDAFISKLDHSKMDEFRKENRIKAIKAAKDKAEYLLSAIGQQLGKPLIIKEEGGSPGYNYRSTNVQTRYSPNASSSYSDFENPEEISFTKIKIVYSVFVKFEIK